MMKNDIAKKDFYDIHGLFKMSITASDERMLKFLEAEYKSFKVEPYKEIPDVELYIQKDGLLKQDFLGYFDKKVIGDKFVYGTEQQKLACWEIAIWGIQDKNTKIYLAGNKFFPYFIQSCVIEPVIKYKISKKGYSLIHGACVCHEYGAILFPGERSTGKTTLVLQQILEGRNFIGEESTILSQWGEAISFPTRIHLFDYALNICPELKKRVNFGRRFSLNLKKILRLGTCGYIKLPEEFYIEEIFPNVKVVESSKVYAVAILSQYSGKEAIINSLDHESAVKKVLAINRIEGRNFWDLLSAYSYHYSFGFKEWCKMEEEIVGKALRGLRCFEILVPKKIHVATLISEKIKAIEEDLVRNL